MDWYPSRDVGSTLILVGAVMIAILFTGRFLPEGFPRIAVWVLLFVLTAALAPAPWIVPPTALVAFLLAILLTPTAGGGCPADQFCEPVSGTRPVLLGSLVVLLSSITGATIRFFIDERRQRVKATREADLPPP